MDTRMIDVAIGLALVLALTSLFVTALQELWSSARGLRGKFLRQAITTFAGNDPAFANQLLTQPLLASMSRGGDKASRTPSYLKSDVVVSTLVAGFAQQYFGGMRPATPGELVQAIKAAPTASAGALAPNAQFTKALSGIVMGVEQDWPAFEARLAAWYDAVTERSIGWFKRHTQITVFVLGLCTAAIANINPIVIASKLWQDEPLRRAVVKLAQDVNTGQERADEPASPASAPAASLVKFTPAARPPFTPAVAEAILGHLAAYSAVLVAAVNAPDEGQDPLVLEEGMRRFIALRSAMGIAPPGAKPTKVSFDAGALPRFDLSFPASEAYRPLAQAQAHMRTEVGKLLAPIDAPAIGGSPAECHRINDPEVRNVCARMQDIAQLERVGLPIGWTGSAWPDLFGPTSKAPFPPAVGNTMLVLLGWLATALACTLGAPFWFDALGKLIKLRAAGAKPEPGRADGAAPQAARSPMLTPSSAPSGSGGAAPEPAEPMSDALNDAERNLPAAQVRDLQLALGMPLAEAVGYYSQATRLALLNWQKSRGLPETGEFTSEQIRTLLHLAPGSDDDGYLA